MNDLGFRVYPSGMAIQDRRLSQTLLVGGDLEVDDLFEKLRGGVSDHRDVEYFMRALKKALELLGTDPNWIVAQTFNPNLSAYRIEFLIDTLIYIETGKRSQSLMTWRALCCDKTLTESKGITLRGHSINRKIVLPKAILFSQPASIISAWISYDGGFADLVESLYLMFGSQATV